MKTQRKITLNLLILLFTTTYSFSQVELEQTYTVEKHIHFLKLEDNTTKYYVFNGSTMKIYNSNHSIYQTIEMEDLGETLYFDQAIIACVSEKVFDIDSGIEFLLCTGDSSDDKTFIIDDDGSILFEKEGQIPPITNDDNDSHQNPWWIANTDDGIKMILTNSSYLGSSVENYVYSLSGTALLEVTEVEKKQYKLNAYPNPSENYVNLEYDLPNGVDSGKLQIYSITGQKIKEFKVDNHVSSLRLSNDDLKSGTYFYKIDSGNYQSETFKLIVSK